MSPKNAVHHYWDLLIDLLLLFLLESRSYWEAGYFTFCFFTLTGLSSCVCSASGLGRAVLGGWHHHHGEPLGVFWDVPCGAEGSHHHD